jgi:hypothetical protein
MPELTTRPALWLGLSLGLIVTLLIGLQDPAHLDRLFLPDDTYYTLSISRSLAAGLGPTTDGIILTSGFQPLIALMQMPAFWLTGSATAPVVWSMVLSAAFGLWTIWLLGRVLVQAGASDGAVLLGMAFAATAPMVLGNHLNGLETSLAMALSLWAALLAAGIDRAASPGRWAGLGAVCGLCLLARIDTCFLVLLIGCLGLGRGGIGRALIMAGTALVVVSPWWGWCLLEFGSPVPESGSAVRQLVHFYRETGLDTGAALASAIVTLSGIGGSPGLLSGLLVLALGLAGLIWLLARAATRHWDAASLIGIAAAILLVFYVTYLPIFWFFERYFQPVILGLIIGAVLLLDGLAGRLGRHLPATRVLPALLGLTCIALNLAPLGRLHAGVAPAGWNSIYGVKGYAQVARDIIAALPEGAVLGAMQSGALGYFAWADMRVVNLDGVVSGPAHRAIVDAALATYLRDNHVGYFADWDVNRDMLLRYAGQGGSALLTAEQQFAPQQSARFTLYRVNVD